MAEILVTPDGPQLDLGDALVPCEDGWLIEYRGNSAFIFASLCERNLHPSVAEPGQLVLCRRDDPAERISFDLRLMRITAIVKQDGAYLVSWVVE